MSKLIGKQAKLDRNKNGKLDSEDFKMLRAGKKKAVKEQFIDRVIGILVEKRMDEVSQNLALQAAAKAKAVGKDAQSSRLARKAIDRKPLKQTPPAK